MWKSQGNNVNKMVGKEGKKEVAQKSSPTTHPYPQMSFSFFIKSLYFSTQNTHPQYPHP
jgi:hypothetical protein